jgi:hypothetical protein
LTDQHKENIWHAKSARQIMKEARQRFSADQEVEKNPGKYVIVMEPTTSAHVGLASTHYSLVKRYLAPEPLWKRFLALWHMWRAAVHANKADQLGLKNADQVDVVSAILSKTPQWLGGNVVRAKLLIYKALASEFGKLNPHTRALLILSLAGIEHKEGMALDSYWVRARYEEARNLKEEILSEPDNLMAKRQWIRIASTIGFYYLDLASYLESGPNEHGFNVDALHYKGSDLILEALQLARKYSDDQVNKITAGLRTRDLEEGFPDL